jgi:regulator of nucleoside diphosphate kinase
VSDRNDLSCIIFFLESRKSNCETTQWLPNQGFCRSGKSGAAWRWPLVGAGVPFQATFVRRRALLLLLSGDFNGMRLALHFISRSLTLKRRTSHMLSRIYITEADAERLRRLIEGVRSAGRSHHEHLDMLEEELDRAEVIASESIPRDVITMNSEARLEDLDSGTTQRYRLVFPHQFRAEDSVSVLAPLGTAMLGYRVGDMIEWPVPKGLRRLKVVEVVYQPEAHATLGSSR